MTDQRVVHIHLRRLAVLTTASALTDVAEFTFDVDDHLYRSVGMGASAIGALMAATGVSSICVSPLRNPPLRVIFGTILTDCWCFQSGGVAKTLIHKLGPAGYTLLANCAFILSTLMKGFATTPALVFAALIPYTLVRSQAILPLLVIYGPVLTSSLVITGADGGAIILHQ